MTSKGEIVDIPDEKIICCCKKDNCFDKNLEKLDNLISNTDHLIDPRTGKTKFDNGPTDATDRGATIAAWLALLATCGLGAQWFIDFLS